MSKTKPNKHFQQSMQHGKVPEVSRAILSSIYENWITEEEFDRIYKMVKKQLKIDKGNQNG